MLNFGSTNKFESRYRSKLLSCLKPKPQTSKQNPEEIDSLIRAKN